MYVDAWRKRREQGVLEPLEASIVDVVGDHPEYQPLLEDPAALTRDWTPEEGATNPFLHMGLHLAIREQVATDRPPGIAAIHAALARTAGGAHEAEHAMIDCLGAALWEAQRSGRAPDEATYLESLRALLRARRR
jgi:hypothetical protein